MTESFFDRIIGGWMIGFCRCDWALPCAESFVRAVTSRPTVLGDEADWRTG